MRDDGWDEKQDEKGGDGERALDGGGQCIATWAMTFLRRRRHTESNSRAAEFIILF
jgi:hypothetical protein